MANHRSKAAPDRPRGLLEASALVGLSDGQLLSRFARHRDELAEAAFTALVHRHGPMVLRVCCQVVGDRHAAEDAFQATFLVLARRAGAIQQPDRLARWLYGVALRTARTTRIRSERRRRRERTGGNALVGSIAGTGDCPERAAAGREELEVLHEEIWRLPQRYRTAVILCELEGLDYQEAAVRMQCPVGTVGVRLRRARQRLRVRLSRRGIVPSAAILGALAGAEAASFGVPAALVGTTAEAAVAYAGAGLASGTIAALATAVLKKLARLRFQTAVRTLLAVGAGAALGWFAVRQARWQPPSVKHVTTGSLIDSAPSTARSPVTAHMAAVTDQGPVTAASATPVPSATAAPAQTGAALLVSGGPDPDVAIEAVEPGRNLRPRRAVEVVRPVLPAYVLEERARGEALFLKQWVRNDPASHGGDGLGPVYNETSCIACHGLASPGGAGPENQNVVILTAMPNGRGRPDGLERIHPAFRQSQRIVLHRFGTHPDYAAWRQQFRDPEPEIVPEPVQAPVEETVEQRIQRIRQQAIQGGRSRVRTQVVGSRGGIRMTVTERNSPALFGAGQIDAIPSDVLVAVASRQPDRLQGRVGRTASGAIGRFGWKAQVASLHEFVRGACASELGLEVPGHAQAVSPVGPARAAVGVDMTRAECDALVAYVRGLPAPLVMASSEPGLSRDRTEGSDHFVSVGCAECHVPKLGAVRDIYSDLLLHRMGPDLDDPGSGYGNDGRPIPDGPSPGEWRTPPLWGFRDTAPYLHDGRARNLEQAVAFHGGQGAPSAHRFFALPAPARAKIEAFLNSLVVPSRAGTPGAAKTAEQEPATDAETAAEAEVLVRHHRQIAVDREERQAQAVERQKRDEVAARRAVVKLPIAFKLETLGKTEAALAFYRQVVRIAPDSREARLAADRIVEITGGGESP